MLGVRGKANTSPSSSLHPALFARYRSQPLKRIVLLLTPLLLCGVEIEHPILDRVHTIRMLAPIAVSWIVIHLALIPLFGLMGWSFALLVEGVQGPLATACRCGAALWATGQIGYESAIGLTSGVVSATASGLSVSMQHTVQTVLTTYLYAPLFNDMALFLILVGLGTVIVTFLTLWRTGAPKGATLLFLGSLCFAWAHESPFGPLGNFGFFAASMLLELTWHQERI